MEIKINGQAIDFTLEKERNLGDIVSGIYNWLGPSEYLITSLEFDDTTIIPDGERSEDWKKLPIDTIGSLQVTILSRPEKQIQDLYTIHQYISLLKRGLSAGNLQLVGDMEKELHYITQNLDFFLKSRGNYGTAMKQLIENAGILQGELKPPVRKLITFCNNLLIILSSRISEMTDPFTELKAGAKALQDFIPKLSEVSVLLQTGRDHEAMSSVIEFTEISEKLLRLYLNIEEQGLSDLGEIRIENLSFSQFYTQLNEILRELEEAFNSRDSVLIGDLLEYEVAPRSQKLLEFIDALEEKKEE